MKICALYLPSQKSKVWFFFSFFSPPTPQGKFHTLFSILGPLLFQFCLISLTLSSPLHPLLTNLKNTRNSKPLLWLCPPTAQQFCLQPPVSIQLFENLHVLFPFPLVLQWLRPPDTTSGLLASYLPFLSTDDILVFFFCLFVALFFFFLLICLLLNTYFP